MQTKLFDYQLPESLIADRPEMRRDHSRLLVLHRNSNKLEDKIFKDIVGFLKAGDVLVLNNSKVFPARLIGRRSSGGKVEILLNHKLKGQVWEAIGRGVKVGDEIIFEGSILQAKILTKNQQLIEVEFNLDDNGFIAEIEKIGRIPLPPYIEKRREKTGQSCDDREHYQTVYAKEWGSCAAPTAGLHFTDALLNKIKASGVRVLEVTLHVGLGTFLPIETDEVEAHKIHQEFFSISKEAIQEIVSAKNTGRRVIAVGTTTTRVLETVFGKDHKKYDISGDITGWTNAYIYPGYAFECIDGLITNFHLPKSSLLLLVSAFASREKILSAYNHAINQKYRFYSYGDAMLIV